MATGDFLKVVSSSNGPDEKEQNPLEKAALKYFPDPYTAPWLRAVRKLEDAGYGPAVVHAFVRYSPEVSRLVGPERAFVLADAVSAVAIKAGLGAAEALSRAAVVAANRLDGDEARFRSWLGLMERFATLAPESMSNLLSQMDQLLSRLNVSRLEAWIMAGIRDSGTDSDRRQAFFSGANPEAAHWLEREANDIGYADMANELKAFMTALWGIHAPHREPPLGAPDHIRRRSGFSSGIIRVPSAYPGFRGAQARDLYRAALAHIGAHMTFSGTQFPVKELKPIQIALVGLIEDARVEHLAMRQFPGLRRLWVPFHIAQSTGVMTAPSLFARLSHALMDPDFTDVDSWVKKGREMFMERQDRLDDPLISREIGNVLGNDIGQRRVQFNAKSYVIEPPYRDDNLGLWDFGDDAPPEAMEAQQIFDAIRIEQQEEDDQDPPDQEREEQEESDEETSRVNMEPTEEEGVAVARYPEYDYASGRDRPDWTTLVEYSPTPAPAFLIDDILEHHVHTVNRIKALITSAKVSRPQRIRGLNEGEFLDVDAAINATISKRVGETPDTRIYGQFERRHRDLSVHVLLDTSESTNDKLLNSRDTVLDVERQATALLAHAMSGLGDPFAIAAFCSNRRDDVRYTRIKEFNKPYDEASKAALAGLTGGYSTRIGAAMRHASEDLKKQQTHRRLLLVVTDGEPSDIDIDDREYLVEDARHVIHDLSMHGIDVFCVGLDSGGDSYLHRIFGRRNVVLIDKLESLPEKLPMLYFRLTA